MKATIKNILRHFLPIKSLLFLRQVYSLMRQYGIMYSLKCKIVLPDLNKSKYDNYIHQIGYIYRNVKINLKDYYIYPYDPTIFRIIQPNTSQICSITVDYMDVLDSDLQSLVKKLSICENQEFSRIEMLMIEHIERLAKRICLHISNSIGNNRLIELSAYFPHLLYRKPKTLDEAIQKLLFYNALFWQAGHALNGLGRLDMVLYEYYKKDIECGRLDKSGAKHQLKQLCLILGKHMKEKSGVLLGDTGQYILLGGIDRNGNTVQNELTEIFLDIFTELKAPDPKLILRVNDNTSDTIWQKAISCILTGCGSPLLMNETRIMNSMVEFGYDEQDVWNVGTSACWEPLIIGKSFDQNNPLPNIQVIKPLTELILSSENNQYPTFQDLLIKYKKLLEEEINNNIKDINFECSPLYTLFFDKCIDREQDYCAGGAKYNYHGVQIVGFPNLINALLNIKQIVYEKKLYTIKECSEALNNNFVGYEDMQIILCRNELKFGNTNEEVVNLTNHLMTYIGKVVSHNQINNNKIKVGFSSSQYITRSKDIIASMDGRGCGEPFATHISPVSKNIDIQEIMDFAGKLNYSDNRINGNVVDFIVPTSFAANPTKLKTILKNAITNGVFELQLNVLDAETLKDAKLHPDKYPNLVVRVWGFSAYFNDLPEEYKDNLIRRAESYA